MRLEEVWVAYAGAGRPAIRDVSLVIHRGRIVLITGPNGAGKTTLLETCLGLLRPLKGRVLLLGVDTRSREVLAARRRCGYVPQDFMRPPFEAYTARRVIELGLAASIPPFGPGRARGEIERRVRWAARLLGIEDLLERPIGTLSGGQQQRVFIARALARMPELLLLDEPFASLDPGSRASVAEAIRRYVDERGATAMVVSHDVRPIIDLADAVVTMDGGEIVRVEGDP